MNYEAAVNIIMIVKFNQTKEVFHERRETKCCPVQKR